MFALFLTMTCNKRIVKPLRTIYEAPMVLQRLFKYCMIIISVYVNNEYLMNVGVGLGVHTQIHPIGYFRIF